MLNKAGAQSLDVVMDKGSVPLSVDTFEAMANHEGAMVLDTRHQKDFVKGFIPNSIFIGVDGSFAPWVGALITDLNQPIIFIADEGREEEVVTRLSRVGYDNTLGYLKGGIEAWTAAGKEVDQIESIPAETLAEKVRSGKVDILDVRKPTEWEAEHAEGAENIPLDYINENMERMDESKDYQVHCAGGYRSVIFASIVKSRGFDNVTNIEGGMAHMLKTDIPMTEYVCPTTLK